MLSDDILRDIADAYSPETIIEILGISSLDLLIAHRDKVQENITLFEMRPVDCHECDI